MNIDHPIRMIRELKGAPLSIFKVLMMVHQRVNQEFLERTTGYTDKPVSQALQYLCEVGLVDNNRSGWQLVIENVKQLPLSYLNLPMRENEAGESDPIPAEDVFVSRKNSDSLITYLMNDSNNINRYQVSNPSTRNNSDMDPAVQDNLDTFRELGIKINKRTSILASRKHINRKYITQTIKNLKSGETLGMAIIRMEQEDAIPPPKKHRSGCGCSKCLQKYGDWEK